MRNLAEYRGLKYEPPKQPSRNISSGDLFGVNDGCEMKWNVLAVSCRVGGEAVGIQAVQPALISSMPSGGSDLAGASDTLGDSLDPLPPIPVDLREAFLRAERSVMGASSSYDGFSGAAASRDEKRVGS